MNRNIRNLARTAMIAAIYFALGIAFLPINFGAVQVRIPEALTLLPVLTPLGIAGVTVGCAITNLYGLAMGANILGAADIVIGSAATLVAAVLSYGLRGYRFRGLPLLAAIPPILVNAVVIGGELCVAITGGFDMGMFLLFAAQVGAGQLISCGLIGIPLIMFLQRSGLARKLFEE